jgi:predicted MPP superfamily phosphohydrolase
LLPAINAMNSLPGTKYPERFGGVVAKPAFVFGCGDITEWPTAAAKNAYEELTTKRLKFPTYDIAGNHDEGGKVPSRTVLDWLVTRHKSLSYVFDSGGVRFVAVFSKYDEGLNSPAQPISKEALQFVREELEKAKTGMPVVLAMHLCLDAITNRDALVEAIGKANVILVLGGHYHKATVQKYRGLSFVQLPSPAANGPGQCTVIRITRDRVLAIPYDYRRHAWADEPGKVLDAVIRLR